MYNPAAPSLLPCAVCSEPCPINYCDPWQSIALNIGFTGSYVHHHQMIMDRRESNSAVRDFNLRTNASYLALNVCELFELFSTVGATDIFVDFAPKVLNKPNSSDKLELNLSTAYSLAVGGRATAIQCDPFFLGFEVEFFRTKPSIISIENTPVNQRNYKYTEWQISGGGAYLIPLGSMEFVPYLGIHFGRTYFSAQRIGVTDRDGDELIFQTFRQLHHVGYSCGTTLVGCGKIQLTAEATFISELAFTFNSSFRF